MVKVFPEVKHILMCTVSTQEAKGNHDYRWRVQTLHGPALHPLDHIQVQKRLLTTIVEMKGLYASNGDKHVLLRSSQVSVMQAKECCPCHNDSQWNFHRHVVQTHDWELREGDVRWERKHFVVNGMKLLYPEEPVSPGQYHGEYVRQCLYPRNSQDGVRIMTHAAVRQWSSTSQQINSGHDRKRARIAWTLEL